MKMNVLKKTILKSTLTLGLLAATAAAAQTFYTPTYRGQAQTESAYWLHSFTNAYDGANVATSVAPGGSALANASITQTTSGAFIIPSTGPDAGDIYSYSSTNTFVLNYQLLDSASFPNGVGNVLFQAYTEGNPLNLDSVFLSYTSDSGVQMLSAAPYTVYSAADDSGGNDEILAWSWNLPLSDDVTSFSIIFDGSDTSVALAGASLDVAGFNAAPVPEPGSLALMGMAGVVLGSLRFLRRQSSR